MIQFIIKRKLQFFFSVLYVSTHLDLFIFFISNHVFCRNIILLGHNARWAFIIVNFSLIFVLEKKSLINIFIWDMPHLFRLTKKLIIWSGFILQPFFTSFYPSTSILFFFKLIITISSIQIFLLWFFFFLVLSFLMQTFRSRW